MTTYELVRRAVTIKLSRPEVYQSPWDARLDWYILGDVPPNYPMPVTISVAQYDPERIWMQAEVKRLRSEIFVNRLWNQSHC